jgi:hypothetical protein
MLPIHTNEVANNDIYITENEDHVIIRWDAVQDWSPYAYSKAVNAELVLYDNNSFKFNYGNQGDTAYGAVIGVAKGDGLTYTASAHNGTNTFKYINTSAWGDVPMGVAAPTVSTVYPTNVTERMAAGIGNLVGPLGEYAERIIEWGTESGVYTNSCSAGTGIQGTFSCTMSNLSPGITYYVRAKATNSAGISYGDEISFRTHSKYVENIIANTYQGGGTAQNWRSTNAAWTYTLPFPFTFYDTDYSQIKISSEGYICLNTSAACTATSVALNATTYGPIIAPMMRDLSTATNANNDIYITQNSDNVVIRWDAVQGTTASAAITFEAVLYDNGAIKFNYGPQSTISGTAIIGVTRGDGTYYTGSIYSAGTTNFNSISTSAWGNYEKIVTKPAATTDQSTNITATAVTANATVTSIGGENVARVIEWGTTSGNYTNSCSAGNGAIGKYSCAMTNLSLNTTYYVRAKVTNSAGTSYGNETTFQTFEIPTEDIITNEYQGGGTAQNWRADNNAWTYTLPFPFKFYDTTYSQIKVSSNGYICLNTTMGCTGYNPTLTSTSYGPFIAPMALNLRTDKNANDIFITEAEDHVIIRWDASQYGYTSRNTTFEAILYDNGAIKFNYGTQTNPFTTTAVVGVSKGDGTYYTASDYNGYTNFNQVDTSAWGDYPVETAIPTVITNPVTNIGTVSAIGNATLDSIGGEAPERIIEWGTETGNYTNTCTAGTGTAGDYYCNITGLDPQTAYFVRAKATNAAGTGYGEETTFTTNPIPDEVTIPDPNADKIEDATTNQYFEVINGTPANAQEVQTNTTVNLTTEDAIVTLPPNTVITQAQENPFTFVNFITQNTSSTTRQQNGLSHAAVKIGVPNTRIAFSNPITITLTVGEAYNDRIMDILYQEDGETQWQQHTPATCTITNGLCTFTTTHATTYTVNGDGTISGANQNDITTDVQDVLSMECAHDDTANDHIVEFGNLTPGTPITATTTCTVTTNSDNGYNLAVKRNDADSTMQRDSDATADLPDAPTWDPTNSGNAQTWSFNDAHLAFTVYDSTATKDTTWWGTGTAQNDANNKYAGFPATFTDIMRHAAYNETATKTQIGYKIDAPTTQKSGTYTGEITYQVTTAP